MISIWERETFYRDVDVMIAGGGLLGLWTAYELLEKMPGLKVTLAEALPVPALASTRNAGFACFGSPSELWADKERVGENAMWQVVERRYRGIGKIRKVFGDKTVGFDPSGGYEVYGENKEWVGEALAEKLNQLNIGFASITGIAHIYNDCTADMPLFGLKGFSSMAGNSIEGGVHSGKLVSALLEKVRHSGAQYLTGHKVEEVSGSAGALNIRISAGSLRTFDIRCRALVWATNASLGAADISFPEVKPARGQVLLSPPIPNLGLRGTFHYDEGYYYFRNLENRLLLGGARNMAFEEECTLSDQPTATIRGHLETFIRNHFPEVNPYLSSQGWMHWTGIMGMSDNKMPIVQEPVKGIWAALACNGMGVALTPLVGAEAAGQVIASLR